jgi:hypothetical protein
VKIQVARTKSQIELTMESSINREKFGDPDLSMLIPSEISPRRVYVESHGGIQEIDSASFRMNHQKRNVLVNVPASSKMVRLVF